MFIHGSGFRRVAGAACAILVGCVLALAALAVEPVNTNRRGVAVKGYDVVAYFTEGRPTKGSPDFTHEWNGATWRFADAENRDLFASAPERYAPQYGGYCAWAVSEGYTANIDPGAWKIVKGKLYLNYSAKVQRTWEQDVPGHIARADENWPRLLDEN